MSIEIGDGGLGYIYLGDILIAGGGGGESGWKPGANTLCYLPLKEDVLDYSGNNNNGTGNPASFDGGVANYTTSSGSTYIPYSLINGTQGTILVWVYWYGNRAIFLSQHTNSTWGFAMTYDGGYATFGWINTITTTASSSNSWSLFTGTWDSSGYKFYYNGAYIGNQATRTTYTNQNLYLGYDPGYQGGHMNLKASELIIEDKVWTADEIQAYYNQTKSNYGL